jgi:hypothetical protein
MFLFRILIVGALSIGLVFGQAPKADAQATGPAAFVVKGDIATPLTMKAEDLASMPREKVSVEEQDGTKVEYEGVPLREILKRAGAPLGNQLRGKALASIRR